MKILIVLFATCVATSICAEEGYWLQLTDPSPHSDEFAHLRANKKQVSIEGCGQLVTEAYGVLTQTYKEGSASNGDKCSWHLHAPDNQRVHIVSVSFRLSEQIKPARSDDYKNTVISIYDGAKPDPANLITKYHVTPEEKVGHLQARSLSSKQDMFVEANYHDHKDFAMQKLLITYEFIDADKVIKAL